MLNNIALSLMAGQGRAGVLIFSMKSLSSTGDKVCDRATAGTWVLLLL